jgi:hypothetical protein
MRIRLPLLLAVFAVVLPSVASAGDALQVNPGKWKTRTSMKSTMSPEPRVTERTECVTESEWDPDTFMKDVEGCALTDVNSSAQRMQWKVACNVQGGRMDGDADYRSQGDRVEGEMRLDMDAGAMKITMDLTFEGNRIGDCDE